MTRGLAPKEFIKPGVQVQIVRVVLDVVRSPDDPGVSKTSRLGGTAYSHLQQDETTFAEVTPSIHGVDRLEAG